MIGRDKFLVLGMFVVLAATALAIRLLPAREPADSAASAPAAVRPVQPSAFGEFRGITLQLQSGHPSHPYEQFIDEIAATGANTVSFVVAGYQEDGSSSSIFVDLRKTPSDHRMLELLAHARQRGLRVVVMPIVLLENAREGEWRGKIAPESWDHWWDDYGSFLFHYAELAQSGGADVFIIGSELVSTEKFTERWRELIRKVRQRFHGRLCYSANWDHYRPIEWWDELDLVGMTTYYDLTGGDEPTVQRLKAAWEPLREDILKWQAGIDRPILFTEVGWPNQTTCAQYPWDYYRSPDKPDPTAQANCFDAFFDIWIDEPAVAGFLVWEWRNYPQQSTGPKDTSYVPTDKPAMDVIRRYFRMPDPRPVKNSPAVAADGRTDSASSATR